MSPSQPLLRATLRAAVLAGTILGLPGVAHADVQVHSGVTLGGVARDLRDGGPSFAFHGGVRADMLLLRSRGRHVGLGPYIEIASSALRTFEPGGGAVVLLPVGEDFAGALSAGGFVRWPDAAPGLAGMLWFGGRGYNFHGPYNLGNGIFVQTRSGLGGRQLDVVLGAELDLAYLAMPFILGYETIRR
jgi:hypothetical protein